MPRTGGIYSAPAGTKGVPNTTIQSSTYNAFVDDLSADANAPRPVTAGGTGATNATAARANLGANNASNLTEGVVPDPQLAANVVRRNTYGNTTSANTLAEGLSITDGATLTNFPYNGSVNNWRTITVGTSARGTQITQNYNDLNSLYFRGGQDGWSAQWNTIWHNGNDGAGSGLDAGLFAGQLPSYYTNISARLGYQPFSRDGDQFQGNISWNFVTGEKTFTTAPSVYLFGNSTSTGWYDNNGSGNIIWSYDLTTNTLNLANQLTSNGSPVVVADSGTYTISITGNAGSLGGAAAATYMSKAILTAAGSPPAGFIRFLGMAAGGGFNVYQQPTGGGAITVVSSW